MKILRHYIRFAMIAAALCLSARAKAADVIIDPNETLRKAINEGMAVIYEKATDGRTIAERTQPIMEKYFDFVLLTRRAAGPHWSHFNAEQQRRTQALLTELAVRSYCSHFDPVVRSEVTYLSPLQLGPDRSEFRTLVRYYGQDYNVSYRAERVDGSWHFYDVIVEGVSLVANYRAQFDSLFLTGGPEGIIHALEQTLAAPMPPPKPIK